MTLDAEEPNHLVSLQKEVRELSAVYVETMVYPSKFTLTVERVEPLDGGTYLANGTGY
jgi:hypothetical protein